MLSATLLDGSSLDLSSPLKNACTASEVDVSRGEVIQALVVSAVIVVIDEVGDGAFEATGKMVVFKPDATFEREVPSLDLSLHHRVVELTARAPVVEPFGQIVCAVRSIIVREQTRTSIGRHVTEPRGLEGQLEHGCDVIGGHRVKGLPGNDIREAANKWPNRS